MEGVLVEFNNSLIFHEELKLSGIVTIYKKNGKSYFKLRNKIFSTVYNLEWVKKTARPFSEDANRWWKSNRDPSFLLTGLRLQEAVDWSNCEDPTPLEKDFIYESRIQEMQANLSEVEKKVIQTPPQSQVSTLPSDENNSIVKSKIEEARELIKEGKAKAAKSILLRLRDKLPKENVSEKLNYEIAANLGACAFELDDIETTIEELKKAVEYQADDPSALANAAFAALLNQEYDEALKLSSKSRELKKENNPQAASIYIQALHLLGKVEEIEKLTDEEPWVKDDPMCCLQIGQIRYDNNQYKEAEGFFRTSMEKNPKNPASYVLFARTVATSVRAKFHEDPTLRQNLPESIKVELQEAEKALNYAINLLSEHESRKFLQEAYLERSGVLALLNRLDESLEDCNKILVEDQENLGAYRTKGTILLFKGKLEEAIECFKKVLSYANDRNTIVLLGDAYLQAKKYKDVIALLSDLWEVNTKEYSQAIIGSLILEAQFYLGAYSQVNEIIKKLIENWPGDTNVLTIIAEQYEREGKTEEAITKYKEALVRSTKGQYERIHTSLVDLYYSQEKYHKVVVTYRKIMGKVTDSLPLRKYLFALYRTDAYKEALSISQQLRGNGKAIQFVTEVEVSILYYINDLEGARGLLIQLCELEPEKISHQTMLLSVLMRLDQKKIAKEILASIDYGRIKDDPIALTNFAKMSKLLGEGRELVFAFRARQIAPNDPETHLTYFHLFLVREDPECLVFRPDKVVVDTIVTLRDGEETIEIAIVNDIPSNYEKRIINESDEQAKKLLGCVKGGKVVWKEGKYEEIVYEIIDIKSKYVAAFQDIASNFSVWFPKHDGLHRISVKDDDFTKIFLSMDERDRWVSEMEMLCREKTFPLSTLAKFIDTSLIYVWNGMVNSSKGRISIQAQDQVEMMQQISILTYSNTIVVDLTALLSLAHLKLLDKLYHYFDCIYVAQPILDELNDVIDGDLTRHRVKAVSWKEEGCYRFKEVTIEEIEKWFGFLRSIRDFVKEKTKVVAVRKILEIGKNNYEKYNDSLGREATASILVASEYKSPLYCDDFTLRLIAPKWDVRGVSSQAVLLAIHTYQHALTREEYYNSLKVLILANYCFIFVDVPTLMWVLKEQGMSVTSEVSRVFKCFEGDNHQEDSAVVILAELIRQVWLESIPDNKKEAILILVLEVLTKNRFHLRVMDKLKIMLSEQFNLMQHYLMAIFSIIGIWQNVKLSGKRLLT